MGPEARLNRHNAPDVCNGRKGYSLNAYSIDIIRSVVRQVFPTGELPTVERVDEGVSTLVYRLRRGRECFYLRVLPEEGAGFAPEARVHALLRERGVRVPEVIYYEDRNEAVGRAVMVTTEIAGAPVSGYGAGEGLSRILAEAGRDLAVINGVPVDGFGWIRRDAALGDALAGERATFREFALEHFARDSALLGAGALRREEVAAIERIVVERDAWFDGGRAWLAHGDFDATHIYQCDGRYTGIIDFGEIRGADRWYDLGHFNLHDGERLPVRALPFLLAGYREVAPLPDDGEARIEFVSLLIGVRGLARYVGRFGDADPRGYRAHVAEALRRALRALG